MSVLGRTHPRAERLQVLETASCLQGYTLEFPIESTGPESLHV